MISRGSVVAYATSGDVTPFRRVSLLWQHEEVGSQMRTVHGSTEFPDSLQHLETRWSARLKQPEVLQPGGQV